MIVTYVFRIFSGSICAQPLLNNFTAFPDDIFNASGPSSPDNIPSSGRLYSIRPWCFSRSHLGENQFLEIILPAIFSLSAVATVGGSQGFVTSYKLMYKVNGEEWSYATVNGEEVLQAGSSFCLVSLPIILHLTIKQLARVIYVQIDRS